MNKLSYEAESVIRLALENRILETSKQMTSCYEEQQMNGDADGYWQTSFDFWKNKLEKTLDAKEEFINAYTSSLS
jgi:hypothetical protein